MYQNNAAGTGTGTTVTGPMTGGDGVSIGAYTTSLFQWKGKFSEFIVFDTDTSSDRAAITTNLNDHWDSY